MNASRYEIRNREFGDRLTEHDKDTPDLQGAFTLILAYRCDTLLSIEH